MADNRPTATEHFVKEIEFLLMCDVGEAAMTQAFGVKARSLERRLHRAGRPDLIPRVFAYQARQTEEREHSGQYRAHAWNEQPK